MLKTRRTRSTILLLAAAAALGRGAPARADKISDTLHTLIDGCTGACANTKIPVVMVMADQLNVEPLVNPYRTKAERLPIVLRKAREFAAADQNQPECGGKSILAALAEAGPAKVDRIESLNLPNAVGAWAVPSEIQKTAVRGDVRRIEYALIDLQALANPPLVPAPTAIPWNLAAIDVTTFFVASGPKGAGVSPFTPARVAFISTGVDATHDALQSRLLRRTNGTAVWLDALGGANCPGTDPCDPNGFGTFLAGVAVGGQVASGVPLGVAPAAQWSACRAVEARADGTLRVDRIALHRCLRFLMDPQGDDSGVYAADVIHIPVWGLPGQPDAETDLVTDIRLMRAGGIVPISATGDDLVRASIPDFPANCANPPAETAIWCGLSAPADYPHTISVGASTQAAPNVLMPTSFRGVADTLGAGEVLCPATGTQPPGCVAARPGPRVFAPGVNVVSAWPGDRYARLAVYPEDIAAAHAVGVAALIVGMYGGDQGPPVALVDRALERSAVGWVEGNAAPPFAGRQPGRLSVNAYLFNDAEFVNAQLPCDTTQANPLACAAPADRGALASNHPTRPANVQMRNLGVTRWTAADAYHMLPFGAVGNTAWGQPQDWGDTDLALIEAAVPPGAVGNFPFTATIPFPGTYHFRWRMARGATGFGSATPDLLVPVVGGDHATVELFGDVATIPDTQCGWMTYRAVNDGTNSWYPPTYGVAAATSPAGYSAHYPNPFPAGGVHPVSYNGSATFADGSIYACAYCGGDTGWVAMRKNGANLASRNFGRGVPCISNVALTYANAPAEVGLNQLATVTLYWQNTGTTVLNPCVYDYAGWGFSSPGCFGALVPQASLGINSSFIQGVWPGRYPWDLRLTSSGFLIPGGQHVGSVGIPWYTDPYNYSTPGPNQWSLTWEDRYQRNDGKWEIFFNLVGNHWENNGSKLWDYVTPVTPFQLAPADGRDAALWYYMPFPATVDAWVDVADYNNPCWNGTANTGGNGVDFYIEKNGFVLASGFLGAGWGWTTIAANSIAVGFGETIRFRIDSRGNNHCDRLHIHPHLNVHMPWNMIGDFNTCNGPSDVCASWPPMPLGY